MFPPRSGNLSIESGEFPCVLDMAQRFMRVGARDPVMVSKWSANLCSFIICSVSVQQSYDGFKRVSDDGFSFTPRGSAVRAR